MTSFLIEDGKIVFAGDKQDCYERLSSQLPLRVSDTMYAGTVIRTMDELGEFTDWHSGCESPWCHLEHADGTRLMFEIVDCLWYAYECESDIPEEEFKRYLDEHGLEE